MSKITLGLTKVPIGTISTGHIESWLARNRKSRKWSKSTRNRYLSAIKQVFKKAHSLDYTMENAASSCKALGFLDTFLVVSPPPPRMELIVCPGAPAPGFCSHGAGESTAGCIAA